MPPKPPRWLANALAEVNRHFSLAWDARREAWAICEGVRHVREVGQFNGAPVFVMNRRAEPALRFKYIGSRILTYVRRNDPRRFRTVKEMIDGLGIDK